MLIHEICELDVFGFKDTNRILRKWMDIVACVLGKGHHAYTIDAEAFWDTNGNHLTGWFVEMFFFYLFEMCSSFG